MKKNFFDSLLSIIDSTGGRRFAVATLAYFLAFKAVANAWITSTSFENIIIYIGLFFITGNTIDQFKPNISGVIDKLSSKLGGNKEPDKPADDVEEDK